MRNRILVGVVGIPAVLIFLFVLPPVFTPIMVAALAAVGTSEMLTAIGMKYMRTRLLNLVLAIVIPFWTYFSGSRVWAETILLAYLLLIAADMMSSGFRVRPERVGAGFFFTVLISGGLSSIVSVSLLELRTCYVFLPIVIPFLVDAVAMFTGMKLGRHKLTPELSPKKTVEGAVGGIIGGIVVCLIYGLVFSRITGAAANYFYLVLYGILGAAISQIGDLTFSYVKRIRKIKDYGTIFPGHGGVLDRFDSVIFCAPLIELLIYWLPAFQAAVQNVE